MGIFPEINHPAGYPCGKPQMLRQSGPSCTTLGGDLWGVQSGSAPAFNGGDRVGKNRWKVWFLHVFTCFYHEKPFRAGFPVSISPPIQWLSGFEANFNGREQWYFMGYRLNAILVYLMFGCVWKWGITPITCVWLKICVALDTLYYFCHC